ncbi:MAG: endonuclease MutS2 [Firmicutes bacterium]|nr:endonuclease MutS2 [Bacillota bacterium]
MNKKALKTLEYNHILQLLAQKASSEMGKEKALSLLPYEDIKSIVSHQQQTSQALSMIFKKGSLPLGGLRDISPYLKRVNVGGYLNMGELLHISDFIRVSERAKNYSLAENKNDEITVLKPFFESLSPQSDLQRSIDRCIISHDEMSDDASDTLRNIRKEIRVSGERIREKLNSILHSPLYKNMLMESVVTIRNERYCVPVKQEYKNSFPGIIHDRSSTGASLFIEPMDVVKLNNATAELKAREKAEIERILYALSEKVRERSEFLSYDLDTLAHLDFVFAKAELSLSMKGTEPKFNDKGYINIKKARHPLIDKTKVVPTDIYLGKDFNTLLITGPNTGGKTVSLKTIGLFTLMGEAGLHIPAFDNSELSFFEEVFADIGDEQSIEQSLSTFSSHMTNIVYILKHVTPRSLVLMDELGAGTDPTEGAALATAVIKHLKSVDCRTVVTTHYSELKVFALSNEGIENASCEFDVQTLKPTYRLLIGIPGKSNAFAISQKLGLPDYIIEDAKGLISDSDIKFEDVITDLEISRKELALEQEKAASYRKEAEKLQKQIKEQSEKLEERKEKILNQAREEAAAIISAAKDESDAIVKQIRKLSQKGDLKEAEKNRTRLKENLEKVSSKIKKARSTHKVPEKLMKGDKVIIHSMGSTGIVSEPADKNGNVTVKAGIMNIKIHISDLSLDQSDYTPQKADKFASSIRKTKASSISGTLDLRGLLADEAIDKLDKYIDDAYLAGFTPITVIHGKGTGALRTAVQRYCEKSPHVKKYRDGEYGEGDKGVTVIELK